MQYGSLTTCRRKNGPAVWSFSWWEVGATGKRVRRRVVIGTVTDLRNRSAARRPNESGECTGFAESSIEFKT